MTAGEVGAMLALAGTVTGLSFGQLLYKQFAVSGRKGKLVAAIGLFVATTACTFLALRHLEVGTVYMTTALSHPLVLLLSAVVLKERIGREHLMATGLIVAGIFLYVQ